MQNKSIEMGHKIRVVCLVNSVGASSIPLENFAAVNSQDIEKHLVVFQQDKKWSEKFINDVYPHSGLQVHSCSVGKGSILVLARLFGRLQPAVVHVHHTSSALAAALLRPFFHFRLMTTAHSIFTNYSYKQKAGLGLAFMMSDQIICNSQNTMGKVPFFIKQNKKNVIYNGVNFQELDRTCPPWAGTCKGLRIGTICRMVAAKDLSTLILAFAHIAETPGLENVELRLVGDGPVKLRLEEMTDELGLSHRIHFTGALSRKDVYKELADLDIFVVSSRWEGFCNAMVEAAAAGKAVVATNIEPLPEVIGSENALFYHVGDDNGLASELKRLCYDMELRETLGKNAQAFVRSRYPLEKSAQEHEQAYKSLAE